MEAVILIIHLVLALAIIGLVLLQRSEGGGLGIGGGGGMGALASAHGTANLLTRTTGICAGLFFVTSLTLAVMAGGHSGRTSIMDRLDQQPAAAVAPVTAPATAPVAGTAPPTDAKPLAAGTNPDGTKPSTDPTTPAAPIAD